MTKETRDWTSKLSPATLFAAPGKPVMKWLRVPAVLVNCVVDMRESRVFVESKVQIRPLHTMDEVHSSVDLQRRVWNYSDKQLVPDHIFVVASHAGGHALGAFIDQELIGFALAFPGFWDGHSYLHSHMVAVAPEHHNRGVGRALKLAQLEDAQKKSINCIKWTFDPLQIKNAHFNIARLGVIAREYLSDFYGRTSSPLHGDLPTDRLVAEWWINSHRVRRILAEGHLSFTGERRIGLPSNIAERLASDSHSGARIQLQLRSEFQRLFNAGYVVTGFEATSKTASYVLEMLTSEDCQADRNQ